MKFTKPTPPFHSTGSNLQAPDSPALLVGEKNTAKQFAGMGPVVLEKGVGFRVWAPNADRVSVVGSFNDWNAEAHPMVAEAYGIWSLFIDHAKPGDQYKYEITNGDKTFQRIDPRVRDVTNSVGVGIVHNPDFDWQGDDFQMPAWNELVIYEAHVGTFHRSEEGKVGTFADYQKKFSYLKKLGVNAFQIMPIAEFAGDYSWGYNPAHPYAVESVYGGPFGFKQFVREAHRAGFAIILDVVYNHFGPSDLDIWQFDGWCENDKGGIYFYNDYRSRTPWGDTRPDYGRGEVRSYIRDNAMMWLEDYHVDGLRYDMTLYIRSVDGTPDSAIPDGWGLTQWMNREIRRVKPHILAVAEDLQNDSYLTKIEDEGGAGFGTQWDAGFVHPIRDVLTQHDDFSRDMFKVRDALYHRYNGDAFQRVIYTESHDEVANGKSRIPSEVDRENPDNWFAKKRATLGLALVLTAPGIPMIFQGQEFLQDGWFHDGNELDWEQADEQSGIVRLCSDLVDLRLNKSGVSRGLLGQHINVFHCNNIDKVVAFHRLDAGGRGDDCVVVVNFSNNHFSDYQIGLPRNGLWQRRFSSDRASYSDDFGSAASSEIPGIDQPYDSLPYRGKLELPPYTAVLFSQD